MAGCAHGTPPDSCSSQQGHNSRTKNMLKIEIDLGLSFIVPDLCTNL